MRRALGLTLLLACAGCGGAHPITPPADFVELESNDDFTQRLVTAEQVVLGVRRLENEPKGDSKFWTKVIENRLRARAGYALVESREVKTNAGQTGRQLRFSRDESARTYTYWLTLFVADDELWIIEAGGPVAAFTAAQPAVEGALAAARLGH